MLFFHNNSKSFLRRMGMAKFLGLLIGILWAFLLSPSLYGQAPFFTSFLQWGLFFWFITFGGIIGLVGLVTQCPLLDKHCPLSKMPSWGRAIVRGGLVGAWFEFLGTFIMYDTVSEMIKFSNTSLLYGVNILIIAVIEGFILGALIDLISTRFGGEGKSIL